MESVATPHPLQIPSSPVITGTFAGRQILLMISVLEATVLSVGDTVASNTEIINNICLPAKVPVIAGEEGICKACGVATLSISYYDLGYKTGEMAVSILQDGEDISKMPIEYAPKFTKEYNKDIWKLN